MMAAKQPDYDVIYKECQKYYVKQVLLIKDSYEYQFNEWGSISSERIQSLYHLLMSIYITGNAINLLAVNNFLSESYMLARALLEKLINYMYVLVCDEDEYQKYLNYTKQKGYRILNRSFMVGDQKAELRWSGSINLDDDPELREAVNQFTGGKGKVITRWTSISLQDRLAIIRDKAKIKIEGLMLSTLGIYDDASEALHGTLYGAAFHFGFFEGRPLRKVEDLAETYRDRLLFLFFALGTSIGSLFEVVSNVYPIEKSKDIAKQSKTYLRELQKSVNQQKPD
jgi:hypothetical protein